MQRFPKIVAVFNFTGNRTPFKNRLNQQLLDSVRNEALKMRTLAQIQVKVKIVEDATPRMEYYPKIISLPDFTEAERTALEAYISNVTSILTSTLSGLGATNIVIHAQPAGV